MNAVNPNYLTEDDIEGLKCGYVNFGLGAELAFPTETGKVIFTVRGLHLYSAVAAIYGVQKNFTSVSTWEQYLGFQMLLTTLLAKGAERDLADALNRGEIPLQERAAAIACFNGDVSGAIAAEKQLRECKAAGVNVIPLGSTKR
jgi:hypothetical protein